MRRTSTTWPPYESWFGTQLPRSLLRKRPLVGTGTGVSTMSCNTYMICINNHSGSTRSTTKRKSFLLHPRLQKPMPPFKSRWLMAARPRSEALCYGVALDQDLTGMEDDYRHPHSDSTR